MNCATRIVHTVALTYAVVCGSAIAQDSAPRGIDPSLLTARVGETHRITPPVALATKPYMVEHPGATYLSIQVTNIQLGEQDRIVVQDAKSSQHTVLRGPLVAQERWTLPLATDTATVRLECASGCRATITRYARGYTTPELRHHQQTTIPKTLQQCGVDDLQNPACYIPTAIYNAARTVARLIRGGEACTGWLIGSAGHLLTNHHCIADEPQASATTAEFGAEAAQCGGACSGWASCRGPDHVPGPTFITANDALDYALLQVPVAITTTYGYLRAAKNPPVVGDRIYIPQHPAARGKLLAVISDQPQRGDGLARLESVTSQSCIAGALRDDLGYYADTDTGSSGAPVLDHTNNLVIGLHQCPGCPNTGIRITDILADLRKRGIIIPDATAPTPP